MFLKIYLLVQKNLLIICCRIIKISFDEIILLNKVILKKMFSASSYFACFGVKKYACDNITLIMQIFFDTLSCCLKEGLNITC